MVSNVPLQEKMLTALYEARSIQFARDLPATKRSSVKTLADMS